MSEWKRPKPDLGRMETFMQCRTGNPTSRALFWRMFWPSRHHELGGEVMARCASPQAEPPMQFWPKEVPWQAPSITTSSLPTNIQFCPRPSSMGQLPTSGCASLSLFHRARQVVLRGLTTSRRRADSA